MDIMLDCHEDSFLYKGETKFTSKKRLPDLYFHEEKQYSLLSSPGVLEAPLEDDVCLRGYPTVPVPETLTRRKLRSRTCTCIHDVE